MTDFLTRLTERALGVANVARPDIPPAFAPTPGTDLELAVDDPGVKLPFGSNDVSQSQKKTNHSAVEAEGLIHRETASRKFPTPSRSLGAPSISNEVLKNHPTEQPTVTDISLLSAAIPIGKEMHDLPPRKAIRELDFKTKQADGKNEAPLRPHIQIEPRISTVENIESPRSKPSASTVHVTIGRVEVRAVMPQPALVQRYPERKASPQLSLEQYLRERNGNRK